MHSRYLSDCTTWCKQRVYHLLSMLVCYNVTRYEVAIDTFHAGLIPTLFGIKRHCVLLYACAKGEGPAES